MSFNNKVVIVTGGSSGIGASTAILFAKEGAQVAIVGRNEDRLKKVSEDISKVGKTALIIKADVTKEEETRTIVKKTVDKFGKLDVLVNNAGIIKYVSLFDESILQVYDEIMNTNLRSTVLLTHLAAPHLVKSKGNIVNISSICATSQMSGFDNGGFAPYCTSKAGMDHFARVAGLELAEKGVRVNTVNPGPVETDIITAAGRDVEWDLLVSKTALQVRTQPEEVADLILFLASDKAKSITGVNYYIDGGCRLKF